MKSVLIIKYGAVPKAVKWLLGQLFLFWSKINAHENVLYGIRKFLVFMGMLHMIKFNYKGAF